MEYISYTKLRYELLHVRKLTQGDIAKNMNVTQSRVSKILSGNQGITLENVTCFIDLGYFTMKDVTSDYYIEREEQINVNRG
ncbi:gp33 [Listeria phage P40]|uniref:gp33 n=1 Tax=Listeria phage P40 TaxID=560178 RepID=UPI00018198E7|nr:gp33 [Listeria phage P40]ACI00393.1 gp33 [Listeria phage P40]